MVVSTAGPETTPASAGNAVEQLGGAETPEETSEDASTEARSSAPGTLPTPPSEIPHTEEAASTTPAMSRRR